MLGHGPWYFSSIRKAIITFGTLFNEISIQRTVSESNNTVVSTLLIPIIYSPKDKALVRLHSDPNLDRPSAMPAMPMMAFELMGMRYDAERKLNRLERVVVKDENEPNNLKYTYTPVPYNFDFELNIIVKFPEDGLKIIEQIVPFFTPDFTPAVNLIPEFGIVADTPVVLRDIKLTDLYEDDFLKRRSIIWTLQFVLMSYIYGPPRSKPIIKIANTSFYFGNTSSSTSVVGKVLLTPGLLANGSPTTNSQLSVNTSLIEVDDDCGYCVDIEDSSAVILE